MGEYWGAGVTHDPYGYSSRGYIPSENVDINYGVDDLDIEAIYRKVMNQHPEELAALADGWANAATMLNSVKSHLLRQSNVLYNEAWRSAEARDGFMEFGPGKTLAYLDEWIDAATSNETALRHLVNIARDSRSAMEDMWERYGNDIRSANDASGWDKTREWFQGFGFGYDGSMREFLQGKVDEVKERFNREARQLATDTGNQYFDYLNALSSGHGPAFTPMNAILNPIGEKPPMTLPTGPGNVGTPAPPPPIGAAPPPAPAAPVPNAPQPQLVATLVPNAPGAPPPVPTPIPAPLPPGAPGGPGAGPTAPGAPVLPPAVPVSGLRPLPGALPSGAPNPGLGPSGAPGLGPAAAPGGGAGLPPPAPARPAATPPGLRDGVLGRGQPNLPPGAAQPPGRTLRRPGGPALPGQKAPGTPGAPAGPTGQGARPPGAGTPAAPPGARRGPARPGVQQPGAPGSATPPGSPGARQPGGAPSRSGPRSGAPGTPTLPPGARARPGAPGTGFGAPPGRGSGVPGRGLGGPDGPGTPTLPPGVPGRSGARRPDGPESDDRAPGRPIDSTEAFTPPPSAAAPPVLRGAPRPGPRRPGGPNDFLPFGGRPTDEATPGGTAPPVLGRPQKTAEPAPPATRRTPSGVQPGVDNEWIGADAARADAGASVLDAPPRPVGGAKVSRLEEVPRSLRGKAATPAPATGPARRGVAPELAARRTEAARSEAAAHGDDEPVIVTDEQAFAVDTPGGGVVGKKAEERTTYRAEPPTALGGN